MSMTATNPGDLPRIPYRVRVQKRGKTLYQEAPHYGQDAVDTARGFAEQIQRIGVDRFLGEREHV